MNPERFTEASVTAVNAAQQLAQQSGHQTLTVLHVLRNLTYNDITVQAINKAGGDTQKLRDALDIELSRLPRLQQSSELLQPDPALDRVFVRAYSGALKISDGVCDIYLLLLALCSEVNIKEIPKKLDFYHYVSQIRWKSMRSEKSYDKLPEILLQRTSVDHRHFTYIFENRRHEVYACAQLFTEAFRIAKLKIETEEYSLNIVDDKYKQNLFVYSDKCDYNKSAFSFDSEATIDAHYLRKCSLLINNITGQLNLEIEFSLSLVNSQFIIGLNGYDAGNLCFTEIILDEEDCASYIVSSFGLLINRYFGIKS